VIVMVMDPIPAVCSQRPLGIREKELFLDDTPSDCVKATLKD
jgi:hypothetical protein